MRISARIAIVLLCSFFFLVFTVAFWWNPHFPVFVLAGENSVGSWMSDTLLIFIASLCLFNSMHDRSHPWILFAGFFLLLALDERFMFHEQIKEHIIFSSGTTSRWVYELPVIAGACIGSWIAVLLWRHLSSRSRVLLLLATIFGIASVTVDVFAAGIVWEECFKLFAELLMACALLLNHSLMSTKVSK
jgi:hypothetical protein